MREFFAKNISQTRKIAGRFSKILNGQDTVGFWGSLGSGKTTFIKGIAGSFGIPQKNVTSGSFVILRRYQGEIPIYHVDLYRTAASQIPDEVYEAIFEKKGLILIEWAERIDITCEYFKIFIELISLDSRKITIDACGGSLKRRLNKL